jgi:hypothetical protein
MSNAISAREHARLARDLIKACGTLQEAEKASGLSDTQLSRYQTAGSGQLMRVDTIADLEEYCGRPVYSAALAARFDRAPAGSDLRAVSCELTEMAASLQHRTREALADGSLTNRELDDITTAERRVEDVLDKLKATRRAIEAAGVS